MYFIHLLIWLNNNLTNKIDIAIFNQYLKNHKIIPTTNKIIKK